jgi:hypothetical protein
VYSLVEDVRNALTPGGSSSDTTTAASFSDAQIEDAINEADSIIDTHISLLYDIPQDPDEALVAVEPVRWWSRDIAAYLATLTFKRSKDIPADEPIRLRFALVMSLLVAIRDGKASVELPPADGGSEVVVQNLYTGYLFGPEDFGLAPAGYSGPGIWPGGPGY